MTSTVYIDYSPQTPIRASWLNDVNVTVYQALGAGGIAPTTAAQVIANLGIPTLTQLAASNGATLVGSGTGTVASVLASLQLADYTALRAYAGDRQSVYVTGYLVTAAPSGIAGAFVRDDHDTTSADNGGTIIVDALARRWKRQYDGGVSVLWFGADPTGVTDSTATIQAAVNYAGSLVTAAALGDPVNGVDVLMRGVFKTTGPIIIDQPNVNVVGQGGCSIITYFPLVPTLYNGATPAFIIGSGTTWYTTGFINTNKYNRISGINIKTVAGQGPFIGIMLTGTRNPVVEDCLVENSYIGLYVENTSELSCQQLSVIGATYSVVLDNRKNRSAANSILNTSSTSNDISSCNFYMLTSYYAQWCGVMAINTGTIGLHGTTIGQFSVGSSSSIIGLPALKAGIVIYGDTAGNFTRSFYASNVVFEADQSTNSDCVRLETTGSQGPITGVTLKNCHVQTYASTPGGPTTNFRRTKQVGGAIYAVSVENCGYTPQSSGYYYGTMHIVEAGLPIVQFRGCYPSAAFNSISNDFGYYCKVMDTVEIDNIIPPTVYPPTGWTANGTYGTVLGGSSGEVSYLHWTGSMNEMSITKTEVYREVKPHLGYVYISFLARGDTGLLVKTIINGQADSDSTINNGTNQGRYSNAITQPTVLSPTDWQRVVYCFNQFDDNYTFDNVEFTLGKAATASPTNFIDIADIRIGYIEGGFVKYNPFS